MPNIASCKMAPDNQKKYILGYLPIQGFFEGLPLDIKLKDCTFTISWSIITAPMFLQEGIKSILIWIFQATHEYH